MPHIAFPYLDKSLDGRRCHLTDEEKEMIKEEHRNGATFRSLSRKYFVDRMTIKAIVNPLWANQRQRQRVAQKPWLKYYDKDKWKIAMRRYRAKKREHGLLVNNPTQPPTTPLDSLT
jgi:hypothetical protein